MKAVEPLLLHRRIGAAAAATAAAFEAEAEAQGRCALKLSEQTAGVSRQTKPIKLDS